MGVSVQQFERIADLCQQWLDQAHAMQLRTEQTLQRLSYVRQKLETVSFQLGFTDEERSVWRKSIWNRERDREREGIIS